MLSFLKQVFVFRKISICRLKNHRGLLTYSLGTVSTVWCHTLPTFLNKSPTEVSPRRVVYFSPREAKIKIFLIFSKFHLYKIVFLCLFMPHVLLKNVLIMQSRHQVRYLNEAVPPQAK